MEIKADENFSKTEIVLEHRVGTIAEEEGVQVNTTGEENSENCGTKRASSNSPPNDELSFKENSKY